MSKLMIPVSGSTSKWINVAFFIVCAVVALGPKAFPAYVPDAWADYTVQTCAYVVGVVLLVNAYLHGAPVPAVGDVPAPPIAPAVKALVLACLFAPLLALGAPRAYAGPLETLVALPHEDLTRAIARANKATPPDTPAAECFGKVDAIVMQYADGIATQGITAALPLTLHPFDDFEKLWIARQGALALKADTNCQAVCSRWGQISPLLSRVKFSLCDALNLVR